MDSISAEEALCIVADIAASWGENREEGLIERVDANMSDAAIAAKFGDDAEEALEVRNLWRALEYVQCIINQKGCEHFDPAVTDGKLTTLIDVVVVG